ncbi:unnamed protein product [Somion occarium]|uniref:F-box protein n=1 Tax=Somion occarium TaxID=3059160 RepID=A0ABP1E9Z3_9APHY
MFFSLCTLSALAGKLPTPQAPFTVTSMLAGARLQRTNSRAKEALARTQDGLTRIAHVVAPFLRAQGDVQLGHSHDPNLQAKDFSKVLECVLANGLLPRDDLKKVALTSNSFKVQAQSILCRSLSITFAAIPELLWCKLIWIISSGICKTVRSLHLNNLGPCETSLWLCDRLYLFKQLGCLAIDRSQLQTDHLKRFGALGSLVNLHLEDCTLNDRELILPRLKLRSLTLRGKIVVSPQTYVKQSPRLPECWWEYLTQPEPLQKLFLGMDGSRCHFKSMAKLGTFSSLRLLALPENALQRSPEAYARFIGNCPALEELEFKVRVSTDPNDLQDIVPDLDSLPNVSFPRGSLQNLRLITGSPWHILVHTRTNPVPCIRVSTILRSLSADRLRHALRVTCPDVRELAINIGSMRKDILRGFFEPTSGFNKLESFQLILWNVLNPQFWSSEDITALCRWLRKPPLPKSLTRLRFIHSLLVEESGDFGDPTNHVNSAKACPIDDFRVKFSNRQLQEFVAIGNLSVLEPPRRWPRAWLHVDLQRLS